jgi:hypothetical protein
VVIPRQDEGLRLIVCTVYLELELANALQEPLSSLPFDPPAPLGTDQHIPNLVPEDPGDDAGLADELHCYSIGGHASFFSGKTPSCRDGRINDDGH